MAVRADGQPQVQQGRADADEHLAAIRVQRVELAMPVDQHADHVAVRPEQPGLGVVYRRCGGRRSQAFTQLPTGVAGLVDPGVHSVSIARGHGHRTGHMAIGVGP